MPSGGSARTVEWWWKGTTQSNGAGAMLEWGSTAGNGLFDIQDMAAAVANAVRAAK
jgi:hypothetical protein